MSTIVTNSDIPASDELQAKLQTRIKAASLVKAMFKRWCNFRRNQQVLSSTYHRYPAASSVPKRTWNRRGAVLMAMREVNR